jgi:hypothetical protein
MKTDKITVDYLKEINACSEAVEAYAEHGKEYDIISLIKLMIKKKYRLDWANWLIVRSMTYKQYVSYAVFAAEQVIHLFEKKYPNNRRPRNAIKAAKKCIKNPSVENKKAAYAAADAAYAAADAAAAHAAYAAAHATAHAAYAAAYAAADAAYAADADVIRIKILKYGLRLLVKDTANGEE